MSVSLEIVPYSESLDLYGDPDLSSAYSLSGSVSIILQPSFSLFETHHPVNYFLQSLELVLEGQSESITQNFGYVPLRICNIKQELLSPDGFFLSMKDQDTSRTTQWNITFNMTVPGWLPATSLFSQDEFGNTYTLYATAKLVNLDEPSSSSSSWLNTITSSFRSRLWTVNALKPITVNRFLNALSESHYDASPSTYFVATKSVIEKPDDQLKIPEEVLQKLHILATVPGHLALDDDSVVVTIRLRTKDLEAGQCERLRLCSITLDVIQQDKCRSSPSPSYLQRYPIPSSDQQPPKLPLRATHALSGFFDMNPYKGPNAYVVRTWSLLPSNEQGNFPLNSETPVFANDAETTAQPTWYTLRTKIPLANPPVRFDDLGWPGEQVLRPTASGPLFTVRHELRVALHCGYVLDDGSVAKDTIVFVVPVKFALRPLLASNSDTVSRAQLVLPPYSHLYYPNGDQKVDYNDPLPLYTARAEDVPLAPELSSSEKANSDDVLVISRLI